MQRRAIFVSLYCLALPISAYALDSLCLKSENVLWSCKTNSRYISICASEDLSATNGYIKYRSGNQNQTELEYPNRDIHPRKAFTFKPSWGTHGGTDALRFKIGEYTYIVWQSWDRGIDDRGVTVKRNGKRVSGTACRVKIMGDWSLDKEIAKFKTAGVPEPAPEEDEYEF